MTKELRPDTGDGRSLPCVTCGITTPDASYVDGLPLCDNCAEAREEGPRGSGMSPEFINSRLHGEICDWFRANGLEPSTLPADPAASIADGHITALRKVQRNGRDVIDPTGADVLKETVTVPLQVEPSPEIAEWLRPRCPTCGR